MADTDKQIADILAQYSEPFVGGVWRVQGQAVILHKALERIAVKAGITWDAPTIVRAEADEAVILVTGRITVERDVPPPAVASARIIAMGNRWVERSERVEWSVGEAKINQNYRVSGRQAAYPFAMAEKRGKDRVTLKLIGAHGLLYSESEADEFKEPASHAAPIPLRPAPSTGEFKEYPPSGGGPAVDDYVHSVPTDREHVAYLKSQIDMIKTINEVTEFMLQPKTKELIEGLPDTLRDALREYAKMRLVALGWPSKKATDNG
jgi:hypothetical protein